MLKIRLMGTKNDITWFKKIMQRHPKVEVLEMSDLYPNKGTDKYYRSYAQQWVLVAIQDTNAVITKQQSAMLKESDKKGELTFPMVRIWHGQTGTDAGIVRNDR